MLTSTLGFRVNGTGRVLLGSKHRVLRVCHTGQGTQYKGRVHGTRVGYTVHRQGTQYKGRVHSTRVGYTVHRQGTLRV